MYIYSTIKLEQQTALHGCSTALEMWRRIQTEYAEAAAESEHLLWGKFYGLKFQSDQNVMGFVAGIEQIVAQLRDIGAKVEDAQIIAKILVSLPPSFRFFISAWDSVHQEERTLSLLTKRLVKEEKTNRLYSGGNMDPADAAFFANGVVKPYNADPSLHQSATTVEYMYSATPAQQFFPSRGGYHGSRGTRGRGGSSFRGGRQQQSHGSRGGSNPQPYHRGGRSYQQSHIVCHFCELPGHVKSKCRTFQKFLKERQNSYDQSNTTDHQSFSYKSSIDFTIRRPCDWYADSGATQHMTDQRTILNNFVPVGPERWKVTGIGGSSLSVRGQGDVKITSIVGGRVLKGTMRGVLYVPNLGTNLYSIGTATDAGSQVLFTNNKVLLSRDGVVLMEGERAGKTLYHLNIQAEECEPASYSALLSSARVEPLSLWHQRFGHISCKTVLKMASLGSTNGLALFNDKLRSSSPCRGCLLGKMHRLSFKTGRTRASVIGQLIHSDVCGPMQVPTPNGCNYFVIFKDVCANSE